MNHRFSRELNSLFLFTQQYPFGHGESFLDAELSVLAAHYKEIVIFHKDTSSKQRAIPVNVKLVHIPVRCLHNKSHLILRNLFFLFRIVISEVVSSRQPQLFIRNMRYNFSHLINSLCSSLELEAYMVNFDKSHVIFYSYWFYDWNLSLSILKAKKKIDNNIARAHNFDLFEEKDKENYLPFRKFCLANTDKILSVSKLGAEYLKRNYPAFKKKISFSYLGTIDHGLNPIPSEGSVFHFVTCSNIVSVKRLHLVVELLKRSTIDLTWTHIGEGPLMEELSNLCKSLSRNVRIQFLGQLTQKEIFDFYKSEPIHAFINTSSSEGIPVSIMEAISFGIPVCATSVGGTPEIVNEKTGLLIDINFDPDIIFPKLLKLAISGLQIEKRGEIKEFWKRNFSANENYKSFCRNLDNQIKH